jgi:hypothetical protein
MSKRPLMSLKRGFLHAGLNSACQQNGKWREKTVEMPS